MLVYATHIMMAYIFYFLVEYFIHAIILERLQSMVK